MHIAVEGCCHGELDKIYETLQNLEKRDGIQIELLLCCGDFQAVRDEADLHCMAVPDKYKSMQNFWKYYNGSKKAPYLTIFIGGNHEASNHLQELPYGGWVAPNIYYLGYAGIVTYKGLRIGGVSGIFKWHDYNKGHFETPPYNNNTKRSVYHVRSVDVFRMKLIQSSMDIMMSHDWPNGIANLGDTGALLRKKPYFEEDIRRNRLGSTPSMELLHHMRPKHWFSGHLHVKFTAVVKHEVPENAENRNNATNFLALDKCLPRRDFLQVISFEPPEDSVNQGLCYDAEWLAVLKTTNELVSVSKSNVFLPQASDSGMSRYKITEKGIEEVKKKFDGNLSIPQNFRHEISPLYNPRRHYRNKQVQCRTSSQTTELCSKLEINDPLMMAISAESGDFSFNNSSLLVDEDDEMPSTIVSSTSINADEIDIGSDSDEESKDPVKPVEQEFNPESKKMDESKNEESIVISSSISSEEESDNKPSSGSDTNSALLRLSLNLPAPVFGATSTPVRQTSSSATDSDDKRGTPERDFLPLNLSSDSDYISSPIIGRTTAPTQKNPRKIEMPLAKNALLASLRGKRLSDTESDLSESSGGKVEAIPRKFKRRNASFYSSQSEEDTN